MVVFLGLAASFMGLQILLGFSLHRQQRICQSLLAQGWGRGSLDVDICGSPQPFLLLTVLSLMVNGNDGNQGQL